ncbi:hypothetical protein CPB85DRAFT_1255493 [Mucidula mucida]|nr:hypothetical protein CPB85DRAFT_1255493 [Mucidula mucida]
MVAGQVLLIKLACPEDYIEQAAALNMLTIVMGIIVTQNTWYLLVACCKYPPVWLSMHREGAAALKRMAGGWRMLAENLALGVPSPVAVTKDCDCRASIALESLLSLFSQPVLDLYLSSSRIVRNGAQDPWVTMHAMEKLVPVYNQIHHPNFDDERAMATGNFSTITLERKHCVLNDSLIVFQEGLAPYGTASTMPHHTPYCAMHHHTDGNLLMQIISVVKAAEVKGQNKWYLAFGALMQIK